MTFEPSTDRASLVNRAKLYRLLRQFFAERDVLEVDTPTLCAHGVSDPHIDNLCVEGAYLQSSPEFAMKRLLASGTGPIYQICHAFRRGEAGLRHNPEFTMLEWYRPGFSLAELMSEVESLFRFLANAFNVAIEGGFECRSYADLFNQHYGLNPHRTQLVDLKTLAEQQFPELSCHIDVTLDMDDQYRDLLFSQGIEPNFDKPQFVTNFPLSQAALAKSALVDGDEVASRFECYWQGVELANGYDELTDGEVLVARIKRDNQIRAELGKPQMAVDLRLLSAMAKMPSCTGVAVGIDRLLMLLTDKTAIRDVISFPSDIA